MKVRAKTQGYYGLQRRYEGDVFEIRDEKQFSPRWMERVVDGPGKGKPKGKAKSEVEPEDEESSGDLEVI